MKKIFLSVLSVVLVLSIFGCGKKETKLTEEQKQKQQLQKLLKSNEIEGLRIDNTSLVYENNETTLTTAITNMTDKIINYGSINAVYTDNENNIYEIEIILPDKIEPSETIYTTVKTPDDLTKAINVNYSILGN